ncbi:hypothetical protein WAI453_005088 [Rhynchosporium graminicola]
MRLFAASFSPSIGLGVSDFLRRLSVQMVNSRLSVPTAFVEAAQAHPELHNVSVNVYTLSSMELSTGLPSTVHSCACGPPAFKTMIQAG